MLPSTPKPRRPTNKKKADTSDRGVSLFCALFGGGVAVGRGARVQTADGFVEIGVDGLFGIKAVVFGAGLFLGCLARDASFSLQELVAAEAQKRIDALGKIGHGEGGFALNQVFDVVEEARDGTLQTANFFLREIVFGHDDVRSEDASVGRVLPRGQSHVGLGVVGLVIDDFGGRMPRDGIVEAVLHHGIEVLCGRRGAVVVYATFGIDVGDLLPNIAVR
mgnify:CR=1 FL=1